MVLSQLGHILKIDKVASEQCGEIQMEFKNLKNAIDLYFENDRPLQEAGSNMLKDVQLNSPLRIEALDYIFEDKHKDVPTHQIMTAVHWLSKKTGRQSAADIKVDTTAFSRFLTGMRVVPDTVIEDIKLRDTFELKVIDRSSYYDKIKRSAVTEQGKKASVDGTDNLAQRIADAIQNNELKAAKEVSDAFLQSYLRQDPKSK